MGKVESAVELLGVQSGSTASYFNHNGDDQSISVRSLLKRANAQNVSFSISISLQWPMLYCINSVDKIKSLCVSVRSSVETLKKGDEESLA